MNKDYILSFQNITKTFLGGHIIANDNVSLNIVRGEIHSLIGENGSGKSTLSSILFGLYKQDSGDILWNSKKVNMHEQGAAAKYKIGMVHQHFHLVNNFSVLDNILIGQSKTVSRFGIINRKKALDKFNEIASKYEIKLKPEMIVRKLNVGDRQKVEIFKTLWEEKDLIIFDEPTATLSVDEIEKLMITIKKLKSEGKTIIFISHKMQEVKQISDRISILRKGKLISTNDNTPDLKSDLIAEQMIGKLISFNYEKPIPSDENLLIVENLSYKTSKGFIALNPISFEIKKGEIFGLAGIQDNGQEEIINTITGLKKQLTGNVKINTTRQGEKNVFDDSIEERNKYISHIPIDRIKHGIISDMPLIFNSMLSNFQSSKYNEKSLDSDKSFIKKASHLIGSKLKFISKSTLEEHTQKIIDSMNVQGANSLSIPIRNLSGGNQQKFVIGREINKNFDLLIAGHPTRGLDINAIDHIYKTLINIIKNDPTKSILLYSLELNELLAVCHRVAIMYKGKIIKIIDPKTTSLEEISKLMVGEK